MLEFLGVSQDELGCRDIAVGSIATMSADRSPIEVRSLCNKLFDIWQIRHLRMVAPPGKIGTRRVNHLFQYPLRRETPTAVPPRFVTHGPRLHLGPPRLICLHKWVSFKLNLKKIQCNSPIYGKNQSVKVTHFRNVLENRLTKSIPKDSFITFDKKEGGGKNWSETRNELCAIWQK